MNLHESIEQVIAPIGLDPVKSEQAVKSIMSTISFAVVERLSGKPEAVGELTKINNAVSGGNHEEMSQAIEAVMIDERYNLLLENVAEEIVEDWVGEIMSELSDDQKAQIQIALTSFKANY